MSARIVTVNRNVKQSFVPILIGMLSTLKYMLRTLFKREAATIQFPEQKRNISKRYRGIHILTAREDGTPKCVACYMCATVCPAECIYIESGERPEKQIEKYCTALRDRPAALRLLRLLRGRLPRGSDHHESRERPRRHVARRDDHRP
jgi:ferredoxin